MYSLKSGKDYQSGIFFVSFSEPVVNHYQHTMLIIKILDGETCEYTEKGWDSVSFRRAEIVRCCRKNLDFSIREP